VPTVTKILLVEDNSEDAEFLRLSLAQHSKAVTLTCVSLIKEAVAALEKERFDVVLLDLNLPDARGAECVERIQAADDLMPIVVLSGQGDEDFAVEILNRGVQDYLVKWEGDGRITLRAIRYAIERKRAEFKVNYLARLDWLTTLPNRHYLRDALAQATKRALRGRRTTALILLDLDRFRAVNETHGHAGGDAVLRAVAERLKTTVREGDLLARLGGDEFAVLLEDVEGPREVEALAREITGVFRKPFEVAGRQHAITVSVGITVCPADGSDATKLLDKADTALKQAKQQGPNAFKFFAQNMHDEVLSQQRLEADLKVAVEQGQFELKYQPQLRLADHRIEAVEALLHWKHPQRGPLGSSEFIAAAEASGCIIPIGLWAIEEVCRQLAEWDSAGMPVPRVGINVAAAQLEQPGFHNAVHDLLKSCSVDPELIELELTERSLAGDAAATRERLHAFRDMGVRLAIDDFGAGLLPLADLQQLPLDVLKIGPSFVAGLDTSKDAQAVCGAFLSIAHGFSLVAVADGVKSEQQEAFLTRHNCLYGQGPYYSPPIEADQVAAKMAESGGQATRRRRITRKRVGAKAG
jgi:diguanylate cyclase (GGDEF)-like protein